MESTDEITVTLSPALLNRLDAEAHSLGIPLEYLVAGLVVDTFEETDPDGRGR